jgi:hypothetical protein
MKAEIINNWKDEEVMLLIPVVVIEFKKTGGIAFGWLTHTILIKWGQNKSNPEQK